MKRLFIILGAVLAILLCFSCSNDSKINLQGQVKIAINGPEFLSNLDSSSSRTSTGVNDGNYKAIVQIFDVEKLNQITENNQVDNLSYLIEEKEVVINPSGVTTVVMAPIDVDTKITVDLSIVGSASIVYAHGSSDSYIVKEGDNNVAIPMTIINADCPSVDVGVVVGVISNGTNPVKNAVVFAKDLRSEKTVSVVTNSKGEYQLALLPGTYSVFAQWGNMVASVEESIEVIADENVNEIDTIELAIPGSVKGNISFDESTINGSSELEGYTVYIPGTSYISITDKDGNFAFEYVVPGSYSLLVAKNNKTLITEKSISVTSGKETNVSLANLNWQSLNDADEDTDVIYTERFLGSLEVAPEVSTEGSWYYNIVDKTAYIFRDNDWNVMFTTVISNTTGTITGKVSLTIDGEEVTALDEYIKDMTVYIPGYEVAKPNSQGKYTFQSVILEDFEGTTVYATYKEKVSSVNIDLTSVDTNNVVNVGVIEIAYETTTETPTETIPNIQWLEPSATVPTESLEKNMMYYNTKEQAAYIYDGSNWQMVFTTNDPQTYPLGTITGKVSLTIDGEEVTALDEYIKDMTVYIPGYEVAKPNSQGKYTFQSVILEDFEGTTVYATYKEKVSSVNIDLTSVDTNNVVNVGVIEIAYETPIETPTETIPNIQWLEPSATVPTESLEKNMMYYNTQEQAAYIYDGSIWQMVFTTNDPKTYPLTFKGSITYEGLTKVESPELNWMYFVEDTYELYIYSEVSTGANDWVKAFSVLDPEEYPMEFIGSGTVNPDVAQKNQVFYNTQEQKLYIWAENLEGKFEWQVMYEYNVVCTTGTITGKVSLTIDGEEVTALDEYIKDMTVYIPGYEVAKPNSQGKYTFQSVILEDFEGTTVYATYKEKVSSVNIDLTSVDTNNVVNVDVIEIAYETPIETPTETIPNIQWLKPSDTVPTESLEKNMMYYNTQEQTAYIYDGSNWQMVFTTNDPQTYPLTFKGSITYEGLTKVESPELNWMYFVEDKYELYIYSKDSTDENNWVKAFSVLDPEEYPMEFIGSGTVNPDVAQKNQVFYNTQEQKLYIWAENLEGIFEWKVMYEVVCTTGTITGTVSLTIDGEVVTDCSEITVYIPGVSIMALTDSEGNFKLLNVPILESETYTICAFTKVGGVGSVSDVSVGNEQPIEIAINYNTTLQEQFVGAYSSANEVVLDQGTPKRGWIYYNTSDGNFYIYELSDTGYSWQERAVDSTIDMPNVSFVTNEISYFSADKEYITEYYIDMLITDASVGTELNFIYTISNANNPDDATEEFSIDELMYTQNFVCSLGIHKDCLKYDSNNISIRYCIKGKPENEKKLGTFTLNFVEESDIGKVIYDTINEEVIGFIYDTEQTDTDTIYSIVYPQHLIDTEMGISDSPWSSVYAETGAKYQDSSINTAVIKLQPKWTLKYPMFSLVYNKVGEDWNMASASDIAKIYNMSNIGILSGYRNDVDAFFYDANDKSWYQYWSSTEVNEKEALMVCGSTVGPIFSVVDKADIENYGGFAVKKLSSSSVESNGYEVFNITNDTIPSFSDININYALYENSEISESAEDNSVILPVEIIKNDEDVYSVIKDTTYKFIVQVPSDYTATIKCKSSSESTLTTVDTISKTNNGLNYYELEITPTESSDYHLIVALSNEELTIPYKEEYVVPIKVVDYNLYTFSATANKWGITLNGNDVSDSLYYVTKVIDFTSNNMIFYVKSTTDTPGDYTLGTSVRAIKQAEIVGEYNFSNCFSNASIESLSYCPNNETGPVLYAYNYTDSEVGYLTLNNNTVESGIFPTLDNTDENIVLIKHSKDDTLKAIATTITETTDEVTTTSYGVRLSKDGQFSDLLSIGDDVLPGLSSVSKYNQYSEKVITEITDMTFSEDKSKLYVLLKQYSPGFQNYVITYNDDGTVNEYAHLDYSRGAILVYNVDSSTMSLTQSKVLGWTEGRNPSPTPTDDGTSTSENNENLLYGPVRFLAVTPKKIIIADDGVAVEAADNGFNCIPKNRVVIFDVEKEMIEQIEDTEQTFITTYAGTSPYSASGSLE